MPEDAGSIYASLALKLDKLDKGIATVNQKLDGMVKKSQQRASGFASFWKNAFQTAFGFGIVQLINKVTAAVREGIAIFAGFQQSMKNVQSVTGATNVEFEKMTEKAKEAGETTRFTARQSADALYYLASAGFTAEQSIAALDGVLQLAGATQSDLASTSETVASIISQFNLQAEDAGRISNVFAAAIGNSQATMDKLRNSFTQVGPVAAGFGYSVEETVGALQELYNAGFRGQQAGRALKSALADLASPTANLESILKKYGIALNEVNPANVELADIITILGEKGLTTADIIDGFGKVAGPQMATLIKQGGDALRKYTADVTNTEAAAEAYEIQNDSLAGSLDFLRSKLEGTAIAIFERLEPGMRDLIDSFIKFLDSIRPVGEILGSILNIFFKFASFSTGVIAKLFEGLFGQFEKSKTPLEKAALNLEKVRKSIERAGKIDKTINRLDDLNNEYERLSNQTELSKEEQEKLKRIIRDIADIVPEAATAFDDYGNAISLSAEKTRDGAKALLETKKAVLLEAKTRLELQKPIFEGILRRDRAEANRAKRERENFAREANIAEMRLAIIETYFLKYYDRVGKGEEATNAWLAVNEELSNELKYLGIELETSGGKARILGQGFKELEKVSKDSEKAIDKLLKSVEKESEVEIRVKDAEQFFKELAEMEKQLKAVETGLQGLKKSTDDAGDSTEDFADKSEDFWTTYKNKLEVATREASLFGDEQEVLKSILDFLRKAYLDLIEKGLDPAGETLQKLRQEYDLTLMELNALIESEKRHTEELQKKEKAEKDIIDMTEDYNEKIQELGKSENELIEIERNRALNAVYASGASEEAMQKAVEAINIYYDKLKQSSEETREQAKITFDEILNYAQQLANALIELWQATTQNRLDELDKQMQAEMEAAGVAEETEKERLDREYKEAKKAGDKKRMMEIENEMKRLEIKEKYEQEAAMIKYKAAMQEWKFSMAAVLISFAQGIAKAIASAPFPANIPAIGFATALGGIQVAAVNAQKPKPPEFETGGLNFAPDNRATPAMLHGDEMVLNRDQMTTLFNAINSGNVGSPASPVAVTVIMEMDGNTIYKGVEKAQNSGIIRFRQSRLIP